MIKLTDILKEINESKQIGNLYHFTYSDNISEIFKKGLRFVPDNTKLPRYKDKFYISATRDYTGGKWYKEWEAKVRITLDGNKISEHYSIEPINVDNIWLKDIGVDSGTKPSSKGIFSEERIFSSKEGYLNPEYIVKMDTIMSEDELRNAIEWSKEDSKRISFYDDSILDYINNDKLNFVKNFNSK